MSETIYKELLISIVVVVVDVVILSKRYIEKRQKRAEELLQAPSPRLVIPRQPQPPTTLHRNPQHES
jgi:hypothetical protein